MVSRSSERDGTSVTCRATRAAVRAALAYPPLRSRQIIWCRDGRASHWIPVLAPWLRVEELKQTCLRGGIARRFEPVGDRYGGLIIDFDRRRVLSDSTEIRLTPKEFELLMFLARHPNRVLTHHAIVTDIWGPHASAQPEHLWVLVGQLRKKLESDPAHPRYLVSEPVGGLPPRGGQRIAYGLLATMSHQTSSSPGRSMKRSSRSTSVNPDR
jgi:Transcriptional regulatory protein, C terminal